MGIFERLFKKKKPEIPKRDRPQPRPETQKQSRPTDEDTRPIKMPFDEEPSTKPVDPAPVQTVTPLAGRVASTGAPDKSRDPGMVDQEIDDAIDSTFDDLFGDEDLDDDDEKDLGEGFSISQEELSRDREETRDLFGHIAVNYIRPVKQFMFELKRGSASVDWIPVCLPAINSMLTSMSTMNLDEEAEVLTVFKTFLEELQNRDLRVIEGEYHDLALDLYSHLETILPQTFLIGDEGVQREGIIIFSLLKQLPDVGKVTLDKLFGAGLSTLEMLFLATPTDLSRTTGIPMRVSEKIVAKVQEYREEMESRPVDEDQGSIMEMIEELAFELQEYHEYYEELLQSGWNDPDFNSKKKEYRKARQETSLKINVLLAELGEVELVEQIEKLPFDKRIDHLNKFLASAQNS